jgi:predicted RNA binding protein YcfA (HicA-like mRNA interferase family)
MPKLPVLSGEELIKILLKQGFKKVRQKGSHISPRKITPDREYRTVVPSHPELARGTLVSILKQCGITKEELIRIVEK